jgi:hypothetical protein
MPPQPEMNARLVACVAENLVPDATPDRWIIVLEALAFSPVRLAVRPQRTPDKVSKELLTTVARLGRALPQIAELFGIPVAADAPMPRPLRPTRRDNKKPARTGGRTERSPRDTATPSAPSDTTPTAIAANTVATASSTAPAADGIVDASTVPGSEESPEAAAN